jgi:starch phosphorylase
MKLRAVDLGTTRARHYDNEPKLAKLDMITSDYFSRNSIFTPLWDVLVTNGDHYMHLADEVLSRPDRLNTLYGDTDAWARRRF